MKFSIHIRPERLLSLGLLLTCPGLVGTHAAQRTEDAVRQALQVPEVTVQALSLPQGRPGLLAVEVTLNGISRVLSLTPHSLRADGFVLLVQGPDGKLEQREPAPSATYRGTVQGLSGSVVAASSIGGRLTAVIRLAPGERPWCIVPLSRLGISAPAGAHAVYDSTLVRPSDGECLVVDKAPAEEAPPSPPAPDAGGAQKLCEIAVDCDTQFYIENDFSVPETQADVESILNANEAIWEVDLDITYLLTALVVRTSEPDPYSSFDPAFLLGQMVGEWSTVLAAIPRDVAQLFTGKTFGTVIGVAYLDSICQIGSQYSLVRSNFSSDFASRVALTAHELGHSWSSGHCDGTPDCKIMCGLFGGCAGDVTSFGSFAKSAIDQAKLNYACLDDVTVSCGFSTYGTALLNPTELSASGPGGVGSIFTLTYSHPAAVPSRAFTVISAEQESFAYKSSVLLVDPTTILHITSGVKFNSVLDKPTETVRLGNQPALVGAEIFLQAMHYAPPSISLTGITEMSNGVSLLICP